ncbi:MAG: hypothetical protein ACRDHP_07130, partial [Ktedonobacterales bacterium]
MRHTGATHGAPPSMGRYGVTSAHPQRQSPRAALAWWWRHTAPPDAAPDSTFAQREAVRRCRMGSALILLVATVAFLFLLASLGLDAAGSVHIPMSALYASAGALAFCLLVLPVTRLGRAALAGLLIIGLLDACCALVQINPATMTGTGALSAFLVCAALVAFSFLPPFGVLGVALANTLLAAGFFMLWKVDTDVSVLALPVAIQWIAAVITFLYAATVREAYRVVCTEAGAVDTEWRFAAEQSMAMQEDIHRMQMALAEVLGGKLDAHVPIVRDTQLADLGAQINQFLAWFQRFATDSVQLQQVREDAERAIQAINALRAGGEPEWPEMRGTPLDGLLDALNGVTNWSEEPLPMPKPSTPLAPPRSRAPRVTIPVTHSDVILEDRG